MFAALAVASVLFSGAAVAAPPAEAFGALPAIRGVSVSPSGKYFALIQNLPGQSAVKTFDAATGQMIGGIAAAKQQIIQQVSWHSDDRLIVFVVEVAKYSESLANEDLRGENVCRILSIPRDGKNPVPLLPKGMAKNFFLSCDTVGLHGPTPDTMLIQAGVIGGSGLNSRSQIRQDFKVHSVNILTGEAEVLDEVGSRGTFDWWADDKGQVRLRRDAVAGEEVLYARLAGSSDWNEIHRQTLYAFEAAKESSGSTASVIDIIGFGADPNKLYVFYWPGDRQAIGLLDLRTRQITQVSSDPKYDVDGAIGLARKVVGARVSRAMPEQIFFDDQLKQVQATIAATYPGQHVTIASASDDMSKLALIVEGSKSAGGAYVLVDLKSSTATTIAARYPTIDVASTGEQKYITYDARDGTKIDAYLTVPRTGGKNLPAIVLPHGGPEARDEGGFDWLSQFFASRGYVVLQPQYRGSTGFGTQFALAGRKEWGAKMQDDVSDGVKYLASTGIADPGRVCIMGWSYGGYAAMAGATLTPDLYRCAIAGAGVSDLIEMLVYEEKYGGGSARYWRKHIGDPVADKAKIDKVSPIKHVANVKAPLLLIHGELDQVVPIKQSEIMAEAMKAAGKPFEFVRLADENHNISFASTRIKTLKAMEEFLAKHNPAR